MRSGESATSASTPIVSAVPAGLVMARDEVFGTVTPSAARIGTTIMVVRLPGIPPMQCLSATTGASKWRRDPQAIIASVSAMSSASSRLRKRARQHEHRELGLRVAPRAHVAEHCVEVRAAEARAAQLAAHALDALRRAREGRVHRRSLRQPEVPERHLREPDLVVGEDVVAAEVQDPGDLAGRLARSSRGSARGREAGSRARPPGRPLRGGTPRAPRACRFRSGAGGTRRLL